MRRIFPFLLISMLACAARTLPAHAQADAQAPGRVVVIDLTATAAEGKRIRVFAAQEAKTVQSMLRSRSRIPTVTRDSVLAMKARKDPRWISSQGDRVLVFALHDDSTRVTIRFSEERRESRIRSDLATLARLVVDIGTARAASMSVTAETYTLQHRRANLAITATVAPAPPSGFGAMPIAFAASDSAQLTLVTGPPERLFLSANAAAVNPSSLEYDEETRSLEPAETPTGFQVGVNFAFGDLLTEPDATNFRTRLISFWNGLYLGAGLRGSRRPFDEVTVHLGARHNPIRFLDVVSFETVSPFAGLAWTKNAQLDDEAQPTGERKFGGPELIWGVSLNLDKALGWVGGD